MRDEAHVPKDNAPGETVPPPYDSTAVYRARGLLESVPERIGPYRIVERIGGGGMGDVYVAEQTAPIKRRVALKLIKAGMDTRQVVARFEAERQALAMMDHPNIARVFDAGTTETGRPYFVMELVRGVPITQFCDEQKLTTRQRVELLIPVCHAVQHAHQKGIIHRDIKPTNVLVTLHDGVPVPKVIDFGIAKATSQPLTDKTVYTEFRQMIGTPAYMSPEQAEMSGLDIDTRSDIYGLGVLMYELLTGTTPFDTARLVKAGMMEIQRIIKEEEPPRPSLRISSLGQTLPSVAAQRGIEPARLGRLVAGELDWIVMRAMEKDRKRRYETASDLAADLNRHLSGEPIIAAPPSAMYRARKFARKRKGLLVATSVVASVLLLGIGATSISLYREKRANAQLKTTSNDLAFAAKDVLDAMLPDLPHVPTGDYAFFATGPGGKLSAKVVEENGTRRLEWERSPNLPDVQANWHLSDLMKNYAVDAIKNNREARTQLEKGLARNKGLLDEAENEAYIANLALGQSAMRADRWAEARQRLDACPPSKRGWEWKYLNRLAHTVRFAIPDAASVKVSPDGRRILTEVKIYSEPGFQVWDSTTGKALCPLTFVGKYNDNDPLARFTADSGQVVTVFAKAKDDQSIRFWSADTGQLLHVTPINPAWYAIDISPDGTRFFAREGEGLIHVADTRSGVEAGAPYRPDFKIKSLCFAANDVIAVGDSESDRYQVVDCGTMKPVGKRISTENFATDMKSLVTIVKGGRVVEILNFRAGDVIRRERFGLRSAYASFVENSPWFATERDGLIEMLDLSSGRSIQFPGSNAHQLKLSPDGSTVFNMYGWASMETGKPLGYIRFCDPQWIPGQRALAGTSLRADEMRASAGAVLDVDSMDSPTRDVWGDLSLEFAAEVELAGRVPSTRPSTQPTTAPATRPASLPTAAVSAESPDGSRLVIADEKMIRFFDTQTGREVVAFQLVSPAARLQFTPDGTRLLIAYNDESGEIWDSRDYAERQKDRDARFAAIPAAKEYVQKLLASDIPTDQLRDRARSDPSLATLRKLVAMEQLKSDVERMKSESQDYFSRITNDSISKDEARQGAGKIAEARVRRLVLAKINDATDNDEAYWCHHVAGLAIEKGQEPAVYRRALVASRRYVTVGKNSLYSRKVLGAAMYRTGAFGDALKVLDGLEYDPEAWEEDRKEIFAFRAMACHALRRPDEARLALRESLRLKDGDISNEPTRLTDEAAALIDPASTQPTSRSATSPPGR